MRCYRCGLGFSTIDSPNTSFGVCPTCSLQDSNQRETNRQIDALEKMQRAVAENYRELERSLDERDSRLAGELSNLIAEQRTTQQLMQEARISREDAYARGYLATKEEIYKVSIKFDWRDNSHHVHVGNAYTTDVLQKEFDRGVRARVAEKINDFNLDHENRKHWAEFSAKRGWDCTGGVDWKIDNCEVSSSVTVAELKIVDRDDFYKKVYLQKSFLNNDELTQIYRENLKFYEDSLNTVEKIAERRSQEEQRLENLRIEAKRKQDEERQETIKSCIKVTLFFVMAFFIVLWPQYIAQNSDINYIVKNNFWTTVFLSTGVIAVLYGFVRQFVFEYAMEHAVCAYLVAFIPVLITLSIIV